MKNDVAICKGIVNPQMVTMGHQFAILENTEIGNIVSRQTCFGIKGSGKFVGTETDVMWRTTWVDNCALPIGQSLIKAETGQSITQAHQRGRKIVTGGTIGFKSMPL